MAMASPPPPPPPLTVGDLNARSNVPRTLMWVAAVYLSSVCLVTASVVAYCIYNNRGSVFPVLATAYWLPPLMLWGVYMGLLWGLIMYMHLFLPRAPLAVREALIDVGMCWIGLPLSWMAVLVTYLGQPWMAVAVSCITVILIAGVVALGVRLHRTYSSNYCR